ncbi:glucose-1-phosphate cytidylyltransferase [Legionella tucsonensis]|uniref:Glucose-1-phosphate cytidylyltransferase (CDP-glucose pyrophosphorylase) n=1 Tax=Legionella tucsonensis TaxID=40335 RepID=A0A0W0ZT72_9GAMM|nr:glucose-1-phosphate cytidylyltransferase [Legionella tucsonensis]KTD72250.1 glucose-1-phosphate cytidylyltransferase (CDP-glucose pyrophosphorylase) [Legionella tucsonensis]
MKAVILAGGMGARISEETSLKPKPMIEIGGKPILWHIMKIYLAHNINDFIICLGYKGYLIKEYFINYFYHTSDVTIDMKKNTTEIHQSYSEPWRITLLDTGEHSMTGGRLKRIAHHLEDEDFCFTYGDGVSNVNITELIEFHKYHKKLATVTAIKPPARFGAINIEEGRIINFEEKPYGGNGWANGGFFVLSPKVIDYISDDSTIWEREPMERLTQDNQITAFQHEDFWYAMDTLRDKNYLEELWSNKQAPWKIW